MDTSDLQNTLEQLVAPLFRQRDVTLVDLAVSGGQRRKVIRFFVDRPDGITVDACAALSREIADLFDTHDPVDGAYVLEVSSPGLTRQLKAPRDFELSIGKLLKLVVDGQGTPIGTLLSVADDDLVLDIDGQPVHFERSRIQKANLHFEL